MGSLSKLKDFRVEALEKYIGKGITIEVACAGVNISTSTYYKWMAEDDEFRQRMDRARVASEDQLVTAMVCAATEGHRVTETRITDGPKGRFVETLERELPPDWRAAKTMLERRFPERWGRVDRVQVEHMKALQQVDAGRNPEKVHIGEVMASVLEGEFIPLPDRADQEEEPSGTGEGGGSDTPPT